jgi:magnesium transporter
VIVDCAHYKEGARQHEGAMSLEEAAAVARGGTEFVWIGLHEPGPGDLEQLRKLFDLHELAVEDAQEEHQRPKIEDYDAYFIVLRPPTTKDR